MSKFKNNLPQYQKAPLFKAGMNGSLSGTFDTGFRTIKQKSPGLKAGKSLLVLVLFFIITFPAYKSLLHPGMFTSHDGEGHIIRMFEFNKALDDGNFPVRWAKRLNWGLGYPFFNFNYPLPYYLTYLLTKISLGILPSYKMILLLSFPLSGFFAFLWLKEHFPRMSAFVGGLFYTLIPYHFVNVYVRGNISETLALTIVPLGFYLTDRLKQRPNLYRSFILSLSISLIILAHNISALLFLPILLLYGFLSSPNLKSLKFLMISLFWAMLTTSFFWIPAIYNKQFIIIDRLFPLYYAKQFPSVKDLIYSKWGFGMSMTGTGQMSAQIGLLHLLFSAWAFTLVFRTKSNKLIIFFFVLSMVSFFMMTSASKPIWDLFKPLQYLQFPWRFLSVSALSISFLSGFVLSIVLKYFSKKVAFFASSIIILGLLFFNRNHWKVNQYYSLPAYWFEDKPYGSTTTVDGEHTPGWQKEDSFNQVERYQVISGRADTKSLVWKTNYHAFEIDAESESLILDRTVYFPGWTVFIDGQKVESLDQYDPRTKGLIGFNLSRGKHFIEVKLMEPFLNKIANLLSITGLILGAAALLYQKYLIYIKNSIFGDHNLLREM